jgi:hypothetical protein
LRRERNSKKEPFIEREDHPLPDVPVCRNEWQLQKSFGRAWLKCLSRSLGKTVTGPSF